MILWLDAHLSPHLATWLTGKFGVEAHSLDSLRLRNSEDPDIFARAKDADAVILTKDEDFVDLLSQHGPPPKVIWLRCGNISNSKLRDALESQLPDAVELLKSGQNIVELHYAP